MSNSTSILVAAFPFAARPWLIETITSFKYGIAIMCLALNVSSNVSKYADLCKDSPDYLFLFFISLFVTLSLHCFKVLFLTVKIEGETFVRPTLVIFFWETSLKCILSMRRMINVYCIWIDDGMTVEYPFFKA